jgi:MYXO-CTERM domain-containing protein
LAASAVPGYHRGMRRAQLGVVIAAALAVATGRAHGQAEVWDGAGRGYIHVPGLAAGGGGLPSRVIFVNDCKPNGCPIVPGNFRLADDSRQNISSIVRPVSTSDPYATRRLAPYTGTAAAWQATIDCVRAAYAPFDVTVVTTEPPPSTSYFEVMAAGLPADIGFPSSVVGVASFACGVIPNAISFAFLNRNPGNVLDACWTVAQQAAHSVGLAHEVLPGDVMSASFSPPEKTFRNQLACIGATGCCEPSQECACGVTDQNSFAALIGLFGPAGPTPPALTLHRPAANAVVAPGFAVEVAIADANGIDHAELRIDDVAVQTVRDGGPTWSFQAPAALAPGPHTVAIHAVDRLGTSATLATEVTVAPGCDDHADCASHGPGLVCADGRCLAGPDVPGGLGAPCATPDDCVAGRCAEVDGARLCAEACPAAGCGEGAACVTASDGDEVCWPSEAAGCGCATGGGAPIAPIAIGLGLAALLGRRRR